MAEPDFPDEEVARKAGRYLSVSDVWAEDDSNTQYNIEIQIAENEDHLRRSRFIQSRLDSRVLNAGMDYNRLPELYLVFITQKDFLKINTGMAQVTRILQGTDRKIDNGVHEIYINLECPAEREVQRRLLDYIKNTDEKNISVDGFSHLAERVRYVKSDEEGVRSMCALMEEERLMGREEGRAEGLSEAFTMCFR